MADKSDEITAIPHLIEVLALSGQIITLDAIGTHTHTHIAEAIIAKKAHYILALKGNQGTLHKETQDQFHFAIRNLDLQHSEGWSYDQKIEKTNGRIVTRSVTANHRLDWTDTKIRGKWRNLRNLIHVETHTTQLSTATKSVEKYTTTSAASTNLPQRFKATSDSIGASRTASTLLRQTHTGHAAKNLGALRRIVLNLHKINLTDTRSLPKKRRRPMLAPTYRNSLLPLA